MTTDLGAVASDTSTSTSRGRAWRAIVIGGLVAGALDILYAFIIWGLRGVSPIRIGQSVAAGLLGREAAVGGGLPTGLFGLLLHFILAIIMAAIYYAVASRVPLLVKRAVPFGLAYGLAIYYGMQYVVLPLSAAGGGGGRGPTYIVVSGILVHMFLVGLPIALFARRALQRP